MGAPWAPKNPPRSPGSYRVLGSGVVFSVARWTGAARELAKLAFLRKGLGFGGALCFKQLCAQLLVLPVTCLAPGYTRLPGIHGSRVYLGPLCVRFPSTPSRVYSGYRYECAGRRLGTSGGERGWREGWWGTPLPPTDRDADLGRDAGSNTLSTWVQARKRELPEQLGPGLSSVHKVAGSAQK